MSALKFDWEELSDKPVLAVLGRGERRMNDGSLGWEALAFDVGTGAVLLTVTPDTDEIVVVRGPAPEDEDWKPVAALADAVGKRLGWCWVGTNYRGYQDSFTLAFGDLVPDVLQPRLTFLAEAAAITCFDLKARTA